MLPRLYSTITYLKSLTLSRQRSLWYRNQSIHLLCKSMSCSYRQELPISLDKNSLQAKYFLNWGWYCTQLLTFSQVLIAVNPNNPNKAGLFEGSFFCGGGERGVHSTSWKYFTWWKYPLCCMLSWCSNKKILKTINLWFHQLVVMF